MVPDTFHDFFVASAGVSGALIGLLFVASSLAPERVINREAPAKAQQTAGVAFLVLSNNLFVALAALIPTIQGTPAVVVLVFAVGVVGFVGSLVLAVPTWLDRRSGPSAKVGLRWVLRAVLLLMLFGYQVWLGLQLLRNPDNSALISSLAVVSLIFYAIGVGHAWELLGARGHGLSDALDMYRERRAQRARDTLAESETSRS